MSENLLQFLDLSAGYNDRNVLHRVSGEVRRKGRVAVIGPNGCGKSTLLKALMGLVRTEVDTLLMEDKPITALNTTARNHRGLGFLRQERNVFPSLSAQSNLEMAFHGKGEPFEQRLAEIIDIFPQLSENLYRRAGLFSGGQRQSLALAMVLMNQPKLLLLDEPLAGLSPKAADELLLTLERIHAASGTSWFIVEHRLPLLVEAVDQVWIMRDGEIIHRDADTSILRDPEFLATHYKLT